MEKTIETIGEIGLECHVDHARMLSAALAAHRGDERQALELLDCILADADMVGVPHVAFADPSAPENAVPRASAEIRAFAYWRG